MNFLKETRKNPWHFVICLWTRGLLDWLPDSLFLKLVYRGIFGKKLNLKSPKTFNEKLQWLKLYNRNSIYSTMVDKYEVKKYVTDIIGKEYIIPTIGVWDHFDDIDFDSFPEQFVLKCTHDSGGLVIVKDRKNFDKDTAKNKIEKCLNYNFYMYGREWPYKNVKPRIIAEKYMEDSLDQQIYDYKFFCFNGEPKLILVCSDRFSEDGLKEDFFDLEWNHLNITRPNHNNSKKIINKPDHLDDICKLVRSLSSEIPFCRIDFYEIDGQVYFGEITFYPASGFEAFIPERWDYILGSWIQITT